MKSHYEIRQEAFFKSRDERAIQRLPAKTKQPKSLPGQKTLLADDEPHETNAPEDERKGGR